MTILNLPHFGSSQEGDTINAGDVIAEIQTDKAVVALEADDNAVMAKILVAEGTANVKVRADYNGYLS